MRINDGEYGLTLMLINLSIKLVIQWVVLNVYSEAAIVLYTWDISGEKHFLLKELTCQYQRRRQWKIKKIINKANYIVYKKDYKY